MALNLADRLAILSVIRPRIRAAVINYALYIHGEATNTANHANRLIWAKSTLAAPDPVIERVQLHVLNQPDYLDDGSSIDDATLTGAVETAINSHYIDPAP